MNHFGNTERRAGGIVKPLRRSPWLAVLDLYRAGGSFRGYAEFALVGVVVLWFLPDQFSFNLADVFRWLTPAVDRTSVAPAAPAVPDMPAAPPVPFAVVMPGMPEPLPSAAAIPGGPRALPTEVALPRNSNLPTFSRARAAPPPLIGDVGLTTAYFDQVEKPLRGHLVAALEAYIAGQSPVVTAALAHADPENPYVLLLKGLDAVSQHSLASLQAGLQMFERAAEKDEPRAMAFAGVLKIAGMPGVARDLAGGQALLERAAAAGDAAAARVLGEGMLRNGWAGTLDLARAQQYLRQASERGDARAAYRLGEMLYLGQGVAKNEGEGLPLIVKAAEGGYAEAQSMLAALTLMPYSAGLTDNPDEALGWLEKSAAQHEPTGMFYLGMFYAEYGQRIGRTDVVRAVELFRRCAEETLYSRCLTAYGTALDLGLGATRDPVKAYAFYSLADSAQPSQKVREKRDILRKTLTPEETARADAIAAEVQRDASYRR